MAADGKRYATDCIAQEDIADVVKTIPSKNTTAFLDCFTYSDKSIDGQSRKKAYTFWESNIIDEEEIGSVKALQKIHAYIFGGLYDFAGQIRTKTIWKDSTLFCRAEYLQHSLEQIEQMPENTFDEIVDFPVDFWRWMRRWLIVLNMN